MNPSRRRTRTRSSEDKVDKREGRERRCSGRRVVGKTLLSSAIYVLCCVFLMSPVVIGRESDVHDVMTGGVTYMKKPRNLNVFAEIEGKMADNVSPKRTTRATLPYQHLHPITTTPHPREVRYRQDRAYAHLSANSSKQNLSHISNVSLCGLRVDVQDVDSATCPSTECSFTDIGIPQQAPIGQDESS